MNIRRFRHRGAHVQDPAPDSKMAPAVPTPRAIVAETPPRVWSLLLPRGFTNDGR
jgi:hypothetical protein